MGEFGRALRVFLCSAVMMAPSARAGEGFVFDDGVLEAALEIAAEGMPGGGFDVSRVKVEVKQGDRTDRLMGVLPDDPTDGDGVDWVIHVYPDNIAAEHPDCFLVGPGSDYCVGLLAGLFHHELQHTCMSDTPMDAGRAPNSCKHAAIDHSAHQATCAWICELALEFASNPSQELLEKILGACAEVRRLERKWNNPEGAEKMLRCLRGEHDKPFTPDGNCPTGYPADPGPGGFANNAPLTPCGCCDPFGG